VYVCVTYPIMYDYACNLNLSISLHLSPSLFVYIHRIQPSVSAINCIFYSEREK